jgi:DnaK suppressor protein
MPLTKQQLKTLEKRLQEERERLVRSLERYESEASVSSRDADGDLTAMPFHMADQGTDTFQQELDASNAARQSRELSEIDYALQKLYEKPETYGICENTGVEIPYERLEIVPWARTAE